MSVFTVFEYFYRDASNYKAWGSLILRGIATEHDTQTLRRRFDSGEFFIAEQLGIPALYAELHELSGGQTEDDHVWHTFHGLRKENSEDDITKVFDTVSGFVGKIEEVKEWNLELSPHWDI